MDTNKILTSLIALSAAFSFGCAAGATCEDGFNCASFSTQQDDDETGSGGGTSTSSSSSAATSSSSATATSSSVSSSSSSGSGGSGGGLPVDVDSDGDGYTSSQGDCDDSSPTIHPLAGDLFGDGVDTDCDGGDYDAIMVSSGVYYVLVPEWVDAQTAAAKCNQLGYERLAEIHSQEEQLAQAVTLPSRNYLMKYENAQIYFGAGKRLWIGLKQIGDKYTWGSGTSTNFTSWYPVAPNGDGPCVEGDTSSTEFPNGGWNDIPCYQQMPFVCETRTK